MVLGLRIGGFSLATLKSVIVFNALNIAGVMVTIGVIMALHRRLNAPGPSRARQQFAHDLVPLILLLVVSVTGLMLTYSAHAMEGHGYTELSLIHALAVMVTLIYLPFGKLFHLFVRPLHLGVILYRHVNEKDPPASCSVCGEGFAGALHVRDLKRVLNDVGIDGRLNGPVSDFSEVCPRCRRRLFGVSQGIASPTNPSTQEAPEVWPSCAKV